MRHSSAVPPLPVVGTCPCSRAVVIGLVFPGQFVMACVCRRPGVLGQRRDADCESQGGYRCGLEKSERAKERRFRVRSSDRQGFQVRVCVEGWTYKSNSGGGGRGGGDARGPSKEAREADSAPRYAHSRTGGEACVVEEVERVSGGEARRFVVDVEEAANESH